MSEKPTEDLLPEQDQFDAEFDEGFELEGGEPERPEPEKEEQPTETVPETVPESLPPEEEPPAFEAPPEQPRQLEKAPDAIAGELENLRKLNPDAAALALEDSAEGEAIRRRLEIYGVEQAQDRAEMTLYRRSREAERQRAAQARIEAANRDFAATLRRGAPAYFDLMNDPNRRSEAERYIRDVESWIESRPYREGLELMEIRRRGSAGQVCDLIRRFEAAKSGRKKDAAAMFAAPSRGAPAAPHGIGDENDFDAGWDLHE